MGIELLAMVYVPIQHFLYTRSWESADSGLHSMCMQHTITTGIDQRDSLNSTRNTMTGTSALYHTNYHPGPILPGTCKSVGFETPLDGALGDDSAAWQQGWL